MDPEVELKVCLSRQNSGSCVAVSLQSKGVDSQSVYDMIILTQSHSTPEHTDATRCHSHCYSSVPLVCTNISITINWSLLFQGVYNHQHNLWAAIACVRNSFSLSTARGRTVHKNC